MGVYTLFAEKFPSAAREENFSLARRTTIGCGGRVACAISPSDAEEAAELLSFLKKSRIPHAFLGAGANTLPPDEDLEAVLVRTDLLRGIVLNGNTLFAGAGVTGGALLRFAACHEIGGFEPFVGIPMSVGGACVMNAGVREGHISDLVVSVLAVRGGKIEQFPLKSCRFGEKTSVFQEGIFVAGVLFRAERSTSRLIAKRTAAFLEKRKSLPKGRSMGCTFVNPVGVSAGELIDRCGLKGLAVGGASVSRLHANFIISEGGTSADVAALIGKIKGEVLKKTGILLREEVRRLDFYRDP